MIPNCAGRERKITNHIAVLKPARRWMGASPSGAGDTDVAYDKWTSEQVNHIAQQLKGHPVPATSNTLLVALVTAEHLAHAAALVNAIDHLAQQTGDRQDRHII